MEGFTACSVSGRFPARFPSKSRDNRSSLSYRRPSRFRVLASRDIPELNKWDHMELKFGKLLGEDPKLTLAKIMARKANPDVSYLDVEKSFRKNKGQLDENMLNIPTDTNVKGKPADLPNSMYNSSQRVQNFPMEGKLNLSRPVMNKGVRTAAELNLSRPVMNKGVKTTRPVEKPALIETRLNLLSGSIDNKSRNPNISLRKPSAIQEDDIDTDKCSKLKIKPNMFLKMRKDSDENFSDVTLLKKPEVIQKPLNPDQENMLSGGPVQSGSSEVKGPDDVLKPLNTSEILRGKPEMINAVVTSDGLPKHKLDKSQNNGTMDIICDAAQGPSDSISNSITKSSILDDGLDIGLQPPKQSGVKSYDVEASTTPLNEKSVNYSSDVSTQASLLGKPQRLDSSAKEVLRTTGKETASVNDEGLSSTDDVGNFISAEQEGREDSDWKRAEQLFHTEERAEVELVSCSSRGFVVSFGSLIGFLPYRNLGSKWKFLAFESWLRKKGLDLSLYRQNLSIVGNYEVPNKNLAMESNKSQEVDQKDEETLIPSMKFEDLLEAYDQEKTKFLSSFVGQRIKVSVQLADRNSRRLIFSGRQKEKEELIEKKRNLMAKLSVGDVVKGCIKKITYFGIFVEVEGVPALIHQSEVSWDATLNPSSFFKIGQIMEAKVHQLDYALERITLSLKEITPDPLIEDLESVVGDQTSLGGTLEAAQTDIEWADVESLIEELQQIDGVQSVSKGRFFLSPGLAPTFQVYMASMFDNQYKLLARYGNKVQEVVVQASLDKEQMKSAILTSTNRVK